MSIYNFFLLQAGQSHYWANAQLSQIHLYGFLLESRLGGILGRESARAGNAALSRRMPPYADRVRGRP
jgi:hypothetical protein